MSGSDTGTSYLLSSSLAGLIAGASGVIIGHPLDTIKVQLQVSGKTASLGWALYRGILPPLLTSGMVSSVNFALFERAKRLLLEDRGVQRGDLASLPVVFYAGCGAGCIISLITTPIGLIKVQQQTVMTKGLVPGINSLYAAYGIKGFYRGFGPMFVMESVGRGVYLWVYELVKRTMEPSVKDNVYSTSAKVTAASCAGCLSWASVYPFDVIKSRLQADIAGSTYKTFSQCVRDTWNQGVRIHGRWGGIYALHRGLGFTMIRAAPVASMVLPVYDSVRNFLDERLFKKY